MDLEEMYAKSDAALSLLSLHERVRWCPAAVPYLTHQSIALNAIWPWPDIAGANSAPSSI